MTRNSMMSETLAETLHGQMGRSTKAVTPLRRRLAGLTAGALALSVVMASAMPVRASDKDDLIAALAALALLGVIISEANNKKDSKKVEHYDGHRPTYPPHYYPPRGELIPAKCAIEVEGRDRREIVVYPENCLNHYGIDRLPHRCAREIKVRGRRDRVYGAECLRDAGYRLQSTDRNRHERPD